MQEMWIPGSETTPGEGNGNPLQYSCLGNPMNRGAWWATVHGVSNQTCLSDQATIATHKHKLIIFEQSSVAQSTFTLCSYQLHLQNLHPAFQCIMKLKHESPKLFLTSALDETHDFSAAPQRHGCCPTYIPAVRVKQAPASGHLVPRSAAFCLLGQRQWLKRPPFMSGLMAAPGKWVSLGLISLFSQGKGGK